MTDKKVNNSQTFKDVNFSDEEISFLCGIINRFGNSMHPYCDKHSFGYFYVSYLLEVLESVEFGEAKTNLSESGKEILRNIEGKLLIN